MGALDGRLGGRPQPPEAIGYDAVAEILSGALGRKITYANPAPALAKRYWAAVRGLDAEYVKIMGMLYMMTRMGTAKKVTTVFEEVMGKKPRTLREFAQSNRQAWMP